MCTIIILAVIVTVIILALAVIILALAVIILTLAVVIILALTVIILALVIVFCLFGGIPATVIIFTMEKPKSRYCLVAVAVSMLSTVVITGCLLNFSQVFYYTQIAKLVSLQAEYKDFYKVKLKL